jgi:hypothetical protein
VDVNAKSSVALPPTDKGAQGEFCLYFDDGASRLLNRLPSQPGKGPPQPAARGGGIMAISNDEKYKDYAHYAAHCLYLETAAGDPDSRAIQREMAAEWLKLANAVRRRSRPEQMQMK